MPGQCVIVGHGRSPEGKRWADRIDASEIVVRMWDCQWQWPDDYGTKYDYGLLCAHPSYMRDFWAHNRREPAIGWVASDYACQVDLPERTQVVDQAPWCRVGRAMGGVGDSGDLKLTRGCIAACWAISSKVAEKIVLIGFDNIEAGISLPVEAAFGPEYRGNPGTFSFERYLGGRIRHGNHDFAIERPLMAHLATEAGVSLVFATEEWEA